MVLGGAKTRRHQQQVKMEASALKKIKKKIRETFNTSRIIIRRHSKNKQRREIFNVDLFFLILTDPAEDEKLARTCMSA